MAKQNDGMNRLYSVEALLTQTGANADHRLRARATAIPAAAAFIAKALGKAISVPANALSEAQEEWLAGATKDLKAHAGKSLVVAGYRQPESVHQLAHIINDTLGNNGKTVTFHKTPANEFGSLADLASDLGKFDQVVNLGCNPVYDGGTDVDGKAITEKTTFRLTDYAEDESHSVKGERAARALLGKLERCPHRRWHHRAGSAADCAALRSDDRAGSARGVCCRRKYFPHAPPMRWCSPHLRVIAGSVIFTTVSLRTPVMKSPPS